MVITNRNLAPGTRLVATYKKIEYSALVLDDGRIKVDSDQGDQPEFKSVSAAGSAIMGGIACNGWRFWSLAEGEQPAPSEAPAAPAKASGKTKTVRVFYRSPNQKGLSDGEVRFYCNACACGFIKKLAEGEEVEACPNGHRNDDAELTQAPAAPTEKEIADVG